MECKVRKLVLLLTYGFACILSAAAIPQRTKWGSDVTRDECYASGGDAYYKAIQAGEVEPYAFSGPPDECTSDGCQHDYWGRRCRWRRNDPQFPSCPRETREGLINLLKDYSRNGAWWAREALTQQPCELWETIRGRTVWFAGDSLSQETAHSFICFLLEYFETAKEAEPVSKNANVMHRLKYNANNNRMTTWCALFKEYTRVCMLRANFGPRMANVLLPALVDLTGPEDIVVLNFGLWSNHLPELAMHTEMFASSFKYHQSRMPNRTYWRETSAQHYSTASGMFDKDKPIAEQSCRPAFPGVNLTIAVNGSIIPQPGSKPLPQYSPEAWETQVVLEGGYRNKHTQPTIDALGLHTIRAWNTSLALWNFHHHTHLATEPQACASVDCDCTHACHPSWTQLWLPSFRDAFGNSKYFMAGGKQGWTA